MVALCGIIVINMKEISCMFRASVCCKFVMRKVLTSEVRALGVHHYGLTLKRMTSACAVKSPGFKYKFCCLLWSWCRSWHGHSMALYPSSIKSRLKGITDKEVRLHLLFVLIANRKWWAGVRKLSPCAPSPAIMKIALLMGGRLLFFSGPLGTRQWNRAKLGKLLPA